MGDALYLQAPFVKEVERLGLVWGFTLKENQPELLREAEPFTPGSPAGVHAEPGREIRYWHLPEVDWPVADRRVRVVKTVRIEQQRRVTVSEKDGQRTKSKTAVTQESTNFYATNFELGSISPLFIHQFSRSRWRIDTEVFQTLTTDCHLKHPAVHQTTALVVLTMIRFLAYTLSLVFYQRQVRSHARGKCETFHAFAKRIAYGFAILTANTVDSPPLRVARCLAVSPGVHKQRRCRCIPCDLETACQAYSAKPFHHRKPIFDSCRVPTIAELVPNPPAAPAEAYVTESLPC